MQITHRQLRAFVVVAEAGSFSLASQRLHLSPSAVSLLIRELECVHDFRLLERTPRHVLLTSAGAGAMPRGASGRGRAHRRCDGGSADRVRRRRPRRGGGGPDREAVEGVERQVLFVSRWVARCLPDLSLYLVVAPASRRLRRGRAAAGGSAGRVAMM